MVSVMFLHFSVHKENILEHTNAKCHLFNIDIHLIMLLNISVPRY